MNSFTTFLLFATAITIILAIFIYALAYTQHHTLANAAHHRDPIGELRFLELLKVLDHKELTVPERHWLITNFYPNGRLFLDNPVPIPPGPTAIDDETEETDA